MFSSAATLPGAAEDLIGQTQTQIVQKLSICLTLKKELLCLNLLVKDMPSAEVYIHRSWVNFLYTCIDFEYI